MQIIKPMQQGIVFRTFSKGRKFYLSVGSLSFFPFHNSQALGTEQQMWETITAYLYDENVFDAGMPKSQGEVMVVGKCCAPEGETVTRQFVDLDIGPIQKRLVVTGNRYWSRGDTNLGMMARMIGHDWRASNPEPALDMDPSYYNMAPADQQLRKKLFKGDEKFSITGMHPDNQQSKSQLPQIQTTFPG